MATNNILQIAIAATVGALVSTAVQAWSAPPAAQSITAREIKIVDTKGKVVATLGSLAPGSSSLMLLGPSAQFATICFEATKEGKLLGGGPAVTLSSLAGIAALTSSKEDGLGLALMSKDSSRHVVLLLPPKEQSSLIDVSSSQPSISVVDGKRGTCFGYAKIAKPDAKSAASIVMFDKKGAFWKAP